MTLKDADKIKEAIQNSDDFVGGSDDIIKVIDSVPEVVIRTDTISRAKAIEAVEFGITYAKAINKETGEVIALFEESNAELKEAANRIKQLPPAQPEIIRCENCKHYKEWESEFTPNAVVTQCMADNFPIRKAIPDGWFCAGAERRTDEE